MNGVLNSRRLDEHSGAKMPQCARPFITFGLNGEIARIRITHSLAQQGRVDCASYVHAGVPLGSCGKKGRPS